MIQLTEGALVADRRSGWRSRRQAFLPVSFVLFLLLFFGLRALYPVGRPPVPKKAAGSTCPSCRSASASASLLLYWVALVFAQAVIAEHQPGGDEPGRPWPGAPG